MTPAQTFFVFAIALPAGCIALLLAAFVPKEKITDSVIVVFMVYFCIGFIGYMRVYAKERYSEQPPRRVYSD